MAGNPNWKKGQRAEGQGRPVGSKTKNWMNPVWWFNLIQEESDNMTPEQKIAVAFKALDLIMPKVPSIAATPTESLENAKSALDLIRGIEERSPIIPPTPEGLPNNAAH